MPVYLLHGFRWPREGLTGIRVRTIMNDLEDVSVDYIQNASSQSALLGSLHQDYPEIMKSLPDLTLLEQYDPEDVTSDTAICQPYAFVGDRVVTIAGGGPNTIQRPLSGVIQDGSKMPAPHGARKTDSGEVRGRAMRLSPKSRDSALSVNVEDVMASGPVVSPEAWEALAELRDQIAVGEKIGWFVVFNGDPDRHVDEDDGEDSSDDDENTADESATTNRMASNSHSKQLNSAATTILPIHGKRNRAPAATATGHTEKSLPPEAKERVSSRSGLKNFFGKKEKSQS